MSDTANAAAPSTENTAPITEESSTDTESTEEGATEEQAVAPAAKKEDANRKKKLKLKVDGEEYDEDIDFDNEEDLIKKLQYSKVAQKRMSEKAQLEKEVENFLTELRKNPRKVLSDPRIGVDIKQLAASMIEEEIENSKKSPDQLEREKLQARLQELEDERKKEKEDAQKRELDTLQQREFERYDMLMTKAIEKSDLPKSPYVVKKMADYMLMGLKDGLDITPEDVLPMVRDEIQNDLKEMFAVMPDEVIEAIVGKDVFTRVRKKNVAKAKAGTPPKPINSSVKDSGTKESKSNDSSAKKISYKDFFNM